MKVKKLKLSVENFKNSYNLDCLIHLPFLYLTMTTPDKLPDFNNNYEQQESYPDILIEWLETNP
ncbi:MAG: hypothetical protein F6K24_36235, partial [Okeania sp. SIO2D1]|nr:hypothetical protein [Okeania sp. SIO2D1]